MNYIQKKLEKIRSKRSLHEYGFTIKEFDVPPYGRVEYAQWLHP
jgi:hypothetical protein